MREIVTTMTGLALLDDLTGQSASTESPLDYWKGIAEKVNEADQFTRDKIIFVLEAMCKNVGIETKNQTEMNLSELWQGVNKHIKILVETQRSNVEKNALKLNNDENIN